MCSSTISYVIAYEDIIIPNFQLKSTQIRTKNNASKQHKETFCLIYPCTTDWYFQCIVFYFTLNVIIIQCI